MRRLSKPGLALSLPYLLVCVVSFGYVAYRLNFQPAGSEFLGVYLILLVSPWGLRFLDALGRLGSVGQVTAALAGFALLNTLLLYALGAVLGWMFSAAWRRLRS